MPASAADELPYGDVVRVAPSTLMIVGRELNPAKGEADIANVILYRPGDTLYVIDSGATPSFRPFLRKAISRMRPFRNLVLINTHGHPDHIGNNDLVMATPAARKRHYMSRLDFSLADNYVEESLAAGIAGVSGYIPGFDDPTAQAQDLFELFAPLEQSTNTRRALESLPQRPFRIGRLRTRGWAFGNDDVEVLRTGAHTHGELVVYFPKTHLLHTADETISIYPVWPESSAARTRRVFVELLAAASGNGARILTEGHTFSVLRGAGRIRQRVRALRDGYDAYDQAVRRLLRRQRPRAQPSPSSSTACRRRPSSPTRRAGASQACSSPPCRWSRSSSSCTPWWSAATRAPPNGWCCRRPDRAGPTPRSSALVRPRWLGKRERGGAARQ